MPGLTRSRARPAAWVVLVGGMQVDGARGADGAGPCPAGPRRCHGEGAGASERGEKTEFDHMEKGPALGGLGEQSPSPGDTSSPSRRVEGSVCGRQTLNAGAPQWG